MIENVNGSDTSERLARRQDWFFWRRSSEMEGIHRNLEAILRYQIKKNAIHVSKHPTQDPTHPIVRNLIIFADGYLSLEFF